MQCKNKPSCEFEKIRSWILGQRQLPSDIWKLVLDMMPNNLFWRNAYDCNPQNIHCLYCMQEHGFVIGIYCIDHYVKKRNTCMYPFIECNRKTFMFIYQTWRIVEIIDHSPFHELCLPKCADFNCTCPSFPVFVRNH